MLPLLGSIGAAAASAYTVPSEDDSCALGTDRRNLFFQRSLSFKLELIMQKINYSTEAQTSPLLTFVLLISFCSV